MKCHLCQNSGITDGALGFNGSGPCPRCQIKPAMNDYHIDFYMPPPADTWSTLPSFSYMRKSFADGAWAMLRAHYNQHTHHRLRKGQEVIATCGEQEVQLNMGER